MKLAAYIKLTGDTYHSFGIRVGVTRRAVQKWVSRERFPRPQQLSQIIEVTAGAVTADDFLPPRMPERELAR